MPPAVFGNENRPRPVPYIFSSDEIQRILQAASELGKRNTFRGHTYQTLFALLACTGLRVSEAIHLYFQDITADSLVIRCSKFRKSRLVPLHQTTEAGLEEYLKRRRAYRFVVPALSLSCAQFPEMTTSPSSKPGKLRSF
jgi:integrase/recombinase XerD